MIQIQTNNTLIYTDQFDYIRVHPSGSAYIICDKNKAEGIMYRGTPYLYADGVSINEVDSYTVAIDADEKNRIEMEQMLTDQYLDMIEAQQDITEL